MTDRTPGMLVCVYYRVAAHDSQRVISTVREFQRTLRPADGVREAQVLLRCDLPLQGSFAPAASSPDARTVSVPALDPSTGRAAGAAPAVDATVMETYRFAPPAGADPDPDNQLRAFLATLEAAAAPLASLLRGARHVELFAPCAS